jgi:predicted Zn-ribbon and HTH transcriptional regulator
VVGTRFDAFGTKTWTTEEQALFEGGGKLMGPTKAIIKDQALYEAATEKLIKDGFASRRDIEDYVNHHYLALPVVDNAGNAWLLDGKPIYCFRGSQYETLDDQRVHLARCPDCGGMGIRSDEFTVESDCIRCIACGHEFDARLEMMET